jgi:hypothetical protein
MSQSSPEIPSDGGNAKRPKPTNNAPNAGSDGPVAPHVPRVILTAAQYAPTGTRGYSPKVSVDMAGAHCWAPYAAVVRALRSLSLLSPKSDRVQARDILTRLYGHSTPFGAARRFPADEVHVCLDRGTFARMMKGIQEPLVKAEAAAHGEEFVSACSSYIYGIGNALDVLTRVTPDDDRVVPVLYDRAVFESAFLLSWTEP